MLSRYRGRVGVRKLAVLVAGLALVGATACEGDSVGGGGRACEGDTGRLLAAYCEVLDRCPTVYPIAYGSRGECEATLCWATTCRLTHQRIGRTNVFGVKQLSPTVNAAHLDACLAWLKTASCTDVKLGGSSASSSGSASPTSPCAEVLSIPDDSDGDGVPAGQSCETASCASGLYCKSGGVDKDAGVKVCPVCTKPAGSGEPCPDGRCASGLYCKYGADGGACEAPGAEGAPCQSSQGCLSGFCNGTKQTCDAHGRQGDPCTAPGDCRTSWCHAGKCDHRHVNGESCATNDDCSNRNCDMATGVCGLPDGTTCAGDSQCAGYCDPASKTCIPRKANGSSCTSDGQCQALYCRYDSTGSTRSCAIRCDESSPPCPSGQICSPRTSSCEAPKTAGAECDDDVECAGGFCDPSSETCRAEPKTGSPCKGAGSCGLLNYCSNGTCTPLRRPGQSCDALDSCMAPYLCLDGKCQQMNLSCAPAPSGKMCAYLRVCDDKSYCEFGSSFVCKSRHGEGSTCSSDEQCEKSAYCDTSATNGPVCAKRLPAGSTCRASECAEGLYCVAMGATSTCAPGPAGMPCDENDGPLCPTGYFCGDRDDVCHAPGVEGSACREDTECAEGLYCYSYSMCRAKGEAGDMCSSSTQLCGDALHCDSDTRTCMADGELGDPCGSGSSMPPCAPGLQCASGTCMPGKTIGQSCSGDAECQSRVCDSSAGCLTARACRLP